ncbi:MAG: TonB-dependent receptor plug domain-containing protein [Bacteroidota bacterium]
MLFRLCMVMLLTFAGGTAFAQLTVTGKISSSANGEGLVGATVLVKGTTTGVISEDGGAYEIQVPSDDATLVISYIGYERQEIAVNGQSTINVTMVATNATLDEVVVTGYSTAKASQVTSAITSVKEEDFNQGQVNDPTQLIQGKVAGLNISKVGGDPNGGFDIRLRGISSFGANASPLIVIDGVIGGELNSVDPNDIQSIDILKDGSAAAIYGTRASAGVIIITTKKGLAGRTSVDYNGYTTVEQVARTAPFATAAEFREILSMLA